MKVKILAALKTKFTGVQDAILGRVADKLLSSGKVKKEEDVATAVDGVTFDEVLTMYGDSRANEAATTAVRSYEQKHNLKDGKPTEKAAETTVVKTETQADNANANNGGGEEKAPAWASVIVDTVNKLSERMNAYEQGRTTESRRSQLETAIASLPDALRKAYLRTPVESQTDQEFTTLLADITNEVAEIERSGRAAGAVTGRPLGSGKTATAGSGNTQTPSGEATDAEVEAVVAKLNI